MPARPRRNLEQGRRDRIQLRMRGREAALSRLSFGERRRRSTARPESCRKQLRWPCFCPMEPLLFMVANLRAGRSKRYLRGMLDSKEKRFILQATANAAYPRRATYCFAGIKIFWPGFRSQSFALTGEAVHPVGDPVSPQ